MNPEKEELQPYEAAARYKSFVDNAMRVYEASSDETFLLNAEGYLKELTQKDTVRFLKAICDSDETLAKIASVSRLHPNGFYRIALTGDPQGSLRLHVWDKSSYPQQGENIHSHGFDFASRIVTGELPSEYYTITNDVNHPAFYRSTFTTVPGGKPIVTQQKDEHGNAITTHLKMTNAITRHQGETYTSRLGYHRVPLMDDKHFPTVTLLLARTVRPSSDIFSVNPVHEWPNTYDPMSPHKLREVLEGVIAVFQSQS